MALGDWLSRLGDNFSANVENAGPQGLASLGAAIASAPRNQWGAGLAQGLAGFKQAATANKKKADLAEALKGIAGDFSPQQRALLDAIEPEQAATIMGQKLFGGGGKSWESKDLDNDGRPDVQIDASTGKIEAYPLNYKDRAYNMLFESGVSPIAPGVGVDRSGSIVPMGADQAPPQLRPTMAPEVAPPQPADMAAMEAPIPNNTDVVRAEPTGTPAPGPAPIPLAGAALARMKLPQPEQGKQWALDRTTLKPIQVPVPGAPQVGSEEAKTIRTQINTTIPNMRNALDQYEQALDKTTWVDRTMGPFGGAPMARLKTLHTNTLLLAKELFNLGVLNGPDYQLMLQMVDDPESWTATARGIGGLKEQIKTFREILNKNVDTWQARAKQSGIEGVAAGGGPKRIRYDTNGNRVQ